MISTGSYMKKTKMGENFESSFLLQTSQPENIKNKLLNKNYFLK